MRRKIMIVPQKHLRGELLFHTKGIRANEINRPWVELRGELKSRGVSLGVASKPQDLEGSEAVFIEAPYDENPFYRFCKKNGNTMYLMAYEPSVIHPRNHQPEHHMHFRRVLTWNEDLLDWKYQKVNFTIPYREGERITLPRTGFGNKKLLCLVSSNKYSHRKNELYSERIRAMAFMERNHPGEFDLYGVGWDQPVIHHPIASMLPLNAAIQKFYPELPFLPRLGSRPSWRGTVGDKKKVLPGYKFAIAYENEYGARGYITEKILEAMVCGCVPIYLGEPEAGKAIPEDCFIDKRKYAYPELYELLSGMGEEEYTGYLDRMESFLNSNKASPFKIDAFIESFEGMVAR